MSLRTVEEVSTQVPADDFQALEDKVYRTIELYKSAASASSDRTTQPTTTTIPTSMAAS